MGKTQQKTSRAYYLRKRDTYRIDALKTLPELEAILKADPDARKIEFSTPDIFMVVHKDDFDLLSTFKWRLHWKGYAQGYHTKAVHGVRDLKTLKAHRLVLNPAPREHVDHINFNKLDNRRSNLRLATAAQSQRSKKLTIKNTSGYIGVYSFKEKWAAYVKGINAYLGCYADIEDAITAADTGRLMAYGQDWAVLNRPVETYSDFLKDIEGVDFSDFAPADLRIIIKSYIKNKRLVRPAFRYIFSLKHNENK